MKTIADTYRDEGRQEGIQQGIEIGEARGKYNNSVSIAKNMFAQGFEIPIIAKTTGFKEAFIRSIVKK